MTRIFLKKVESVMKENTEAFNGRSNTNMFGPKFEGTIAKSLSSKAKSK